MLRAWLVGALAIVAALAWFAALVVFAMATAR
jgi:hypothetical protein